MVPYKCPLLHKTSITKPKNRLMSTINWQLVNSPVLYLVWQYYVRQLHIATRLKQVYKYNKTETQLHNYIETINQSLIA